MNTCVHKFVIVDLVIA